MYSSPSEVEEIKRPQVRHFEYVEKLLSKYGYSLCFVALTTISTLLARSELAYSSATYDSAC
jgi:hypothetical protein